MLNLSLLAVSRGEVRAQWAVGVDDALLETIEPRPVAPLIVEVVARPIGEDGVFVRGHLSTEVVLSCDRCLMEVRQEIDEPVDLLFERVDEEEAAELAGEVYPLPSGAELDLSEPIREQLTLRMPGYALCDEACRGLCPQCGANLNETPCDCVHEAGPSPWDALKRLTFD